MTHVVSRTVLVPAAPEDVFDLLADPLRHAEFDGSGTVHAVVRGPKRLSLGARFGMRMTVGPVPYVISNTVVEFEEARLIAWRHLYRHVWRYLLRPDEEGGGTWLTEEFDYRPALSPRVLELAGYPERNARGIELTLERIRDLFESAG